MNIVATHILECQQNTQVFDQTNGVHVTMKIRIKSHKKLLNCTQLRMELKIKNMNRGHFGRHM
jgi:hypothetical protein